MSFGVPPFSGHFGGEGVVSSMGVVGTLGTADSGGTADILPFSVDPATGAQYVTGIGTFTTNGAVNQGTPWLGTSAGTFAWPVKLYFSDGVAVNESGGNILVNVQNFAIGQFGNSDNTSPSLTSAIVFSDTLVFNSTSGSWDRLRGDATSGAWTNIKAGTVAVNLLPLPGVLFGTLGTIGTTSTAIPISGNLSGRKSIIFYNLGTSRIWLTGSNGIGSTGIPVGIGDYSPSIDIGTGVIYGVADTAGGTVTTLEVS